VEFLIASAIGMMTAAGVFLLLRGHSFPMIIGLAMLSYAVNLFLFAMGRLVIDRPPVYSPDVTSYTDPLPQALVLTAIVISFGMTAVLVMVGLGAYLEAGNDRIDIDARDDAAEDGERTS
jgi:multicomponent K+:H+ antiporter subunit C